MMLLRFAHISVSGSWAKPRGIEGWQVELLALFASGEDATGSVWLLKARYH
jgi:hypothetical protein